MSVEVHILKVESNEWMGEDKQNDSSNKQLLMLFVIFFDDYKIWLSLVVPIY